MCPVIRTTCQVADWPDVAAQFVGDDDAWHAKAVNQALQKALGRLRVTLLLKQNIKNITIGIGSSPKPGV